MLYVWEVLKYNALTIVSIVQWLFAYVVVSSHHCDDIITHMRNVLYMMSETVVYACMCIVNKHLRYVGMCADVVQYSCPTIHYLGMYE